MAGDSDSKGKAAQKKVLWNFQALKTPAFIEAREFQTPFFGPTSEVVQRPAHERLDTIRGAERRFAAPLVILAKPRDMPQHVADGDDADGSAFAVQHGQVP